jgi:alkyl sulfatase BDS1-like metallo-beta-lactamase superfamily hydrolase
MPDLLGGAPQVNEVTEGVHVARGFHLGNVIKIATNEGAVVVDTTGGTSNAARARDALAEASPGAAVYLVYTHCHNDHTSGGEAFATDATKEIVAHDLLPAITERDMALTDGCLGHWTRRHRSFQMGRPIDANPDAPPFADRTFLPPTLTFEDELDLEVGGLTLHLEHTEGETRDHLLVWIPERKVLLPGDLVYASFPNLSTPAIGPRPIEGWLRSIERFLELEPEHLVGSHSHSVSGKDQVRDVLTAYRDAIAHIWTESVRAIDAGVPVHVAARTITLPPHLRDHPWLGEVYGTYNWGVRAVYDRLTGWYDFTPASVNPLPREHRDRALVEVAGADAICERAAAALGADDYQLTLELTDVVLAADPFHRRANELQIEACAGLRRISTSANEKGFFHSGEVLAKQRLAQGGPDGAE